MTLRELIGCATRLVGPYKVREHLYSIQCGELGATIEIIQCPDIPNLPEDDIISVLHITEGTPVYVVQDKSVQIIEGEIDVL